MKISRISQDKQYIKFEEEPDSWAYVTPKVAKYVGSLKVEDEVKVRTEDKGGKKHITFIQKETGTTQTTHQSAPPSDEPGNDWKSEDNADTDSVKGYVETDLSNGDILQACATIVAGLNGVDPNTAWEVLAEGYKKVKNILLK